jgi:diguanylate cyclase (GGDEF)-like protein
VVKDFQGFIQVGGDAAVRSWLGIPLVYEGRSIGLFALDSFKPNFYNDSHIRIASNLAEHIAIAVQHARQHSIVKEEARTDKLTGIANRYGLETVGQELFLRTSKADQPLGVLMLDIDFFKKVNDGKGHNYGDLVLKIIARGIQQSLRTKDYLVRYGGEEFLVLLPETTTREALVVAERLRERIPALDVDGRSSCPTVSIGLFSGVPGAQDLLHEFIHRADLALYEAKQAGRNRCRVWSPKPEFFESKDATTGARVL